MSNLIRSARSGDDWTENDLEAYNIQIQLQDAATFFGDRNMPPPTVDQEILTTQEAEDMLSDRNAELIHLLNLAMKPASIGESAADDFAVELLKQLGYVKRHRVARTRKDFSYLIYVCLLDRLQNDILLVIQEDKRFQPDDPRDPRPQLIAKAIAAFDYNNRLRVMCSIATHLLVGTMPTFYKIPVTANLMRDVRHGTYPSEPTIVFAHVPDLPRPHRRYSDGMKPLDNRQAILRCYEAFKCIVGI
ncbi:hypothetical protein WOLCODRAFT_134036 [Wolfiporia cocos MD-104 SS10]|uniref:Uncharacterized protein n=1 Tax=Wolfiporia cocos (strain MD-104) TaxID=742152 RepID=A0A2H3J174_WOLCO|nr:hypothetical protein WOLCODRAFT_134036 [Wolfiporia cocos MD-104 SS10]